MQQRFLLQILLLARHVSGTTVPIIRSSRVLYSGCCLWYFVLWFSSCWSGVELTVMCPVCRMLHHPQFLYNGLFNYWFFGIFGISISDFLYMNEYFKWFWTEGGHIQFTVIISLVVCGQTKGSERDNETNVDSWRIKFRAFAGCCSILQTGHITLSSTPDQQLENHSTKYHRQQPLYNTPEFLMMGIVVPKTCWASNKICKKKLCCI